MEMLQPLIQAHRLVNARCSQTWVEFQVLPHDRGRSVFEILVFLLDLDQVLEVEKLGTKHRVDDGYLYVKRGG